MLKRITFKKIIVTTAVIFALLLIYLIPGVKDDELEFNQELEYVDTNITKSSIYLLDSKNNLAYTNIIVSSDKKQIEKRAKEILEILIMDGSGESKIPSGFRSILPSDTKILSINYDNKLIKVNFSKEILEINKNLEEKMIEVDEKLIHTIKELKNPTVLMTNSPEDSATPFIEYLDLNNIFDHHIYDAKKPFNMESHISDIRAKYPDHNIYKIGDNLTNDIHSSKALGLNTIYINHYNTNALNDVTVFSLKELNEYLYKNFVEA